jgi:phospholipid/cholesterol/gamma-HCH transport system substrate-binding protein
MKAMQSSPVRDLTVGMFVLVGLAAIAYLSVQVGGLNGPRGFHLYATFDQIGGLTARAPVVISGVEVGQVSSIGLDEDLRARVELDLDPSLELSIDTSASIMTEGVLGNKFVALEPGGEEELLRSGEEVAFTESAVLLERLIGKFVNDAGLEEED